MGAVREFWHRVRGWWLLTAAAAVTAVLAAVSQAYPGVVAGVVVAVGSAVVAVLAERGRVVLAERAKVGPTRRLSVSRVDRITDPIRLGVHPAAAAESVGGGTNRVPPFVDRDRLPALRAALEAGGFVLVVGDSTAGKSRLAYEAMRLSLPRYACVVPERPDALAEAIAAAQRRRPAVLWLDDLERYLGVGGLTRGDLAGLLDAGQIVVLATLRGHERDDFSARHDPHREPGDRQVARASREVLCAVDVEIRLQRQWSAQELAAARELTADTRIAQALKHTGTHGLAELMAAGPQLLSELQDAWSAPLPRPGRTSGDVRGAALVTAAVDVARTGYHQPVPLPILRDLHEAYLAAHPGAGARAGSWDDALSWATHPLHGTSSLLEPADDERYTAFDYLVDAAAEDPAAPPVPERTWIAVIDYADPVDAVEIAWQASFVGRLELIVRVFDHAMSAGQYVAAARTADCLGDAGREQQAVELLETTIERAERSGTVTARELLDMRHSLVRQVGEKIAGLGDPERALIVARRILADSIEVLGPQHSETLRARLTLARQLGACGDAGGALALARQVREQATAALGAEHVVVLEARFEVAVCSYRIEGPAAAARLWTELFEDARSQATASPWFLLDCVWNLGGALLQAGDPAGALPWLDRAVTDARLVYGKGHKGTLGIRLIQVDAVGATGGAAAALEAAGQLVEDSTRSLGEGHQRTLGARRCLARWTAGSGDAATAVRILDEVEATAVAVLGTDHPLVAEVRADRVRLVDA